MNYTCTSNNYTSLFNAPFEAKQHSTYRVLNACVDWQWTFFFKPLYPMAEAQIKKASKTAQDYLMQYAFLRKHQKLQRDPIWKALYWILRKAAYLQFQHVCSMHLLMQNINPLTRVLKRCANGNAQAFLLGRSSYVWKRWCWKTVLSLTGNRNVPFW